jgi:hypothetical protein
VTFNKSLALGAEYDRRLAGTKHVTGARGLKPRLLRNELVIRKHGRCSELWSIAFVFLTTESSGVKKVERPKAV